MEGFTRITIGIITIHFTVALVSTMGTTGILLIIPTILIPLIITATTILIITEVITHTGTIITLLILTTIVMTIIVIQQLGTEVHYPHVQIAEV